MEKKDNKINLRISKKDKERIEFLSKEYGYSNISDYIIKSSLRTFDNFVSNKYKINTLTLNPAVDYIIKTKNKLSQITEFNSEDKLFEVGGKGINASIIINEFNVKTTAFHYSGDFSGELIKNLLNEKGIQQFQIESDLPTRINIKLNTSDGNFEINSNATPLSKKAKGKIIREIFSLNDGEILMIMGSYHLNDESFIIEISEIAYKKNIQLVYDLSTPFILNLLKFNPIIIKPNKEELEKIFNKKFNSEEKIITSMKKLKELGAQNVAVTMGKDGSILLDEKNNILKAEIEPIDLESPQGSGDSFISTFVVKKSEGIEEAFKWANAAGVATAQVKGLANFKLIKFNLDKIKIKYLK